MSGKKRMATVLSESESDEEERSKTLGSAASTSKAQKIRHNPKSSASTRPSGVAASLTAPAQDRSTSNRLSPSIVNESADLSNLPMTGQGAANLHNVSDIKKHIESLNTHISFLKSVPRPVARTTLPFFAFTELCVTRTCTKPRTA
jgi:hypothetical protein